jgi:hypothetical protein
VRDISKHVFFSSIKDQNIQKEEKKSDDALRPSKFKFEHFSQIFG